jgi:polyisoprenoid-binding protein YceI
MNAKSLTIDKPTLPDGRRATLYLLAFFCAFPFASRAQTVPTFVISPENSSIRFHVKASIALDGTFDKWNATFTVTSTDAATGVLDVKIQADSVNTGSHMKDDKLKGKDFFDVKQDPLITFHSNKIVQTGPDTFDVQGTFTIRGVSKPRNAKPNAIWQGDRLRRS